MLVDSAKRSKEKVYRVLMLRDVLSVCSEDEQEAVSL